MKSTAARREYQRLYAARRRARALAALNAHATFCERRAGASRCGARLVDRVDQYGRVVRHCPHCARRQAGVCLDCPRPVEGRRGSAIRCAAHKKAAHDLAWRKSSATHREERNARWRARYATMDPAKKAARLAVKAAWRRANPEKVKRQKRREALRQSPARAAYHAAYRAERSHARAERERARARAAGGLTHQCLGCAARLRGRPKRCDRCKERARRAAERALRAAGWTVSEAA